MQETPWARRREAVREKLSAKGLDALLVSYAANRYYLSGFELHDSQCNESVGMLLIQAKGRDKLLTDPRFTDAAKRLWPEEDIFIYSGAALDQIAGFVSGEVKGRLGFEPTAMPYSRVTALKDKGLGNLEPVEGIVEELRLYKDEAELEAMAASCAVNHAVMEAVPGFLVPGRTEAEVAWDIEKAFRDRGCTELAFSCIVASGPNGALPHAIPGADHVPENGPMLIDVGGRFAEYCSDQTRTFWVGDTPSDAFLRTRDLVQQAQQKAMDIIKPGVAIADAHNAALAHFAAHGVDAQFTHSLGHGIGLETHEPPSVNPRTQGEFKPGMVVTVEPGLYYPEWGGIRWEYMVLVTEDGCRAL